MLKKPENKYPVPKIKPTDEQFFIDRFIEILLMQVESNENEYRNKKEEVT